ncbi:MAG: recombinase RecT [Chloroflexi bacterium]|nr:recombinase RecT [Chloroflexota bacterium]
MTSTAATVITPGQRVIQQAGHWTKREAEIISTVLGRDLTPGDLRAYAAICKHTGLDPFKRQIYAWKDKGRLTIHIAIGGWRGLAARTGTYNGQTPPEWCGPDGQWRGVWLEEDPPAAARVGVYRTGQPLPVWGVVTWREFQRTQSRTGARGPTLWDEKGPHMLAVRAEYQALQKACPEAFEASSEAIQQFNVAVEAVSDEEIPVARQLVDGDTGEILDGDAPLGLDAETAAAPAQAPASARKDATPVDDSGEQPGLSDALVPPWMEEWNAARAAAGLVATDKVHLAAVLGCAPGEVMAAIPAWLAAEEGRTIRGLVSAAVDRKIAAAEGGRR